MPAAGDFAAYNEISAISFTLKFINKRLQVAFTHALVHIGASVYSPGPEED